MTLKEWITNDEETVLYELENLLDVLGVKCGQIGSLREVVDSKATESENFIVIYHGPGAYMSIVTDTVTGENWLYYNVDKAYEFLRQHREETEHNTIYKVNIIEDVYKQEKGGVKE